MCFFSVLLILVSQRVEILNIGDEAVDSELDKMDREKRGSPASLVEWIILAYVAGKRRFITKNTYIRLYKL